MLSWRIYYRDGSTYDNLNGPPEGAPRLGVQLINIATEKEGRVTISEKDYYCWRADLGYWIGVDINGLFTFLLQHVGPVCFGELMAQEAYDALARWAMHDPDFPPKSLRNQAIEGRP